MGSWEEQGEVEPQIDEEEGSGESEDEEGAQVGAGSCLSLVKEMTRSPIQWMLDLRMYGLKIWYNTTSEGHIDWVGDQILYKEIQFTMAGEWPAEFSRARWGGISPRTCGIGLPSRVNGGFRTEKLFADRAILLDENRLLFQQNNEKTTRQSVRSTVTGNAKIMTYDDIARAEQKRAAKVSAKRAK